MKRKMKFFNLYGRFNSSAGKLLFSDGQEQQIYDAVKNISELFLKKKVVTE
jgi:hypothetical protein